MRDRLDCDVETKWEVNKKTGNNEKDIQVSVGQHYLSALFLSQDGSQLKNVDV